MQQTQGPDPRDEGFTPAKLEELRRKEAATRSHQNAKLVDDYATSIMSSMLLVNGGAIAAVLTAVATEKVFTTGLGNILSALALLAFGVGVFSALAAVLNQRKNAAEWRNVWERRVHGDLDSAPNYVDAHGKAAESWLWWGVIAFLAGVLAVAVALYIRQPSAPAPVKTANYENGIMASALPG